MKTTLDKATRDDLISRINTITENSTAQWGKMTAYQMVKHCRQWEEMVSGQTPGKRSFIGRLFGQMALKRMTKDDSPVQRNMPTNPELKAIEGSRGDMEAEKNKWIAYLKNYDHVSASGFIHPFFGKMTREQIACLAYKHADHHLRQFNA